MTAEIAAWLERRAAGGHAVLSERKFAQVHALDEAPWSVVVARNGAGDVAGLAHLRWEEPSKPVVASVELLGDDRATSEELVDAAHQLLAEAGGGPWHLWVRRTEAGAARGPAAAEHVAEQAGLSVTRRVWLMHRPLQGLPDTDDLPSDVRVRRFREEADDDALIRINNAAFADHPEQGQWTHAELGVRRAADWYDPADILLAWRGQEPVGFHWTKRHPPGQRELPGADPLGEVYILAVEPAHQGGGLGRGLLRAGLRHLQGHGCAHAVLFVDADEPAVRLYTSEGFGVAREDRCYLGRVVPPTAAAGDG